WPQDVDPDDLRGEGRGYWDRARLCAERRGNDHGRDRVVVLDRAGAGYFRWTRVVPIPVATRPRASSAIGPLRMGGGTGRPARCFRLASDQSASGQLRESRPRCRPPFTACSSHWSGQPDSNRRCLLGRQTCYHYTMAATAWKYTAFDPFSERPNSISS